MAFSVARLPFAFVAGRTVEALAPLLLCFSIYETTTRWWLVVLLVAAHG